MHARATARQRTLLAVLCAAALIAAAGTGHADPGTRADRAALFDYLLVKTLERESFSPIKNRTLGLDVGREMRRYREDLLDADTDEKLYYALVRISNARKDRHLTVALVEGGLTLADTTGVERSNYPEAESAIPHAPIGFVADFGTPGQYFVFVADYDENVQEYAGTAPPEIGDKLVAVNGQPVLDYLATVEPYHRYSTTNGLWWQFATWLPQRSSQFPPWLYRDEITYRLERRDGETYDLTLPYLPPDRIEWTGAGRRRYPGFERAYSTETYDLWVSTEDRPVIILAWHGFQDNLVADVDRLLEYGSENEILDHAVIWDGTGSRGGSLGAYALQRLSPKPFKATFGNLRLSDITEEFIEMTRERFEAGELSRGTVGLDDGSWLMAWLDDEVTQGLRAGQAYSNDVPFKLAHLPKFSDGTVEPAAEHFRGPLVCLLGPYGGSHLDQFASMVIDNELGHVIGMPAGGYSNTWEWEEVLRFPTSGKPLVRYMWSIGHTIRPNGQVLEGNPAAVDELVPITRDNFLTYYPDLIARALRRIEAETAEAAQPH